MIGNKNAFVWTDETVMTAQWLSIGPAIAALFSTSVVLIFAAVLYRNPSTRHALRRQSFQLMLAAQAASIFYSSSFIVEVLIGKPTPSCAPSVIVGLLSANFFNFVISLIALNLHLAIVHSINTSGYTKWYILSSIVASLVSVVPSTVMGVWGWDDLSNACWIAEQEPRARIAWVVATQYFPNFFATFVALVCTITVLWRLLALRVHMRRLFRTQSEAESVDSRADLVRRVTLRIIWYPLMLIVVNTVAMSSDMSIDSSGGIATYADYRLWCVYGFFYGALPLFYSLIALFLDPAFASAIRTRTLRTHAPFTPEPVSTLGFRHGSVLSELELSQAYASVSEDANKVPHNGRLISKASASTFGGGIVTLSAPGVTDLEGGDQAAAQATHDSNDDLRRRIPMSALHHNNYHRRASVDVYIL